MKLSINAVKYVAFVLFILLGLSLFAQDKSEFKDKLKSLKGKVDKVTVKVDGKDVVFEGEDAEKLIEIVKPGDGKKMVWISTGDDSKMVHVGGNQMKVFTLTDDDNDPKAGDQMKKKIKVEVEDGKKKVTVTTMKDGKEETKTYEGEEAEKMLKEEKDAKTFNIKIDDEEGGLGENVFYMRHSDSGCGKCCCGGHSMNAGPKHMIIKKLGDDDEKDVQIIVKKKHAEEKKEIKKDDKKEEKK